jgi:Zn-dependent oligopeptidase
VSPTTIDLTPQSETDALCKDVLATGTYSLVLAVDMYATVFKKDPLGAALENVYKNKILLVGGSQDEKESL